MPHMTTKRVRLNPAIDKFICETADELDVSLSVMLESLLVDAMRNGFTDEQLDYMTRTMDRIRNRNNRDQ